MTRTVAIANRQEVALTENLIKGVFDSIMVEPVAAWRDLMEMTRLRQKLVNMQCEMLEWVVVTVLRDGETLAEPNRCVANDIVRALKDDQDDEAAITEMTDMLDAIPGQYLRHSLGIGHTSSREEWTTMLRWHQEATALTWTSRPRPN